VRGLLLAVMVSACGPIVYVNDVTRRASDSVDHAHAASADKYAPYYWTRANEYLVKARDRAAHADFQGANRFGKLAYEAAELAEQEAIAAKKDPSRRPIEVKPDVAPAKPKGDEPIAPAKDSP
jgi:uncharacterized protein DUF4398